MKTRNLLRRTLFFLMCLMVTSSVSALEVTVDGLVYDLSGTSATVLHVGYGNQNSTIEIPATVMYDGLSYTVTRIGNNAFCNYSNTLREFTSLVYYSMGTDNSVSYELGACYWSKNDMPLARCNSYVETVILPNSIKDIGNGAFYNNRLISVVMQEGIISIGASAFGCSLMPSLHLPSSIQTIGDYAFVRMTNLTRIVIPASVKSFGSSSSNIFSDCDLLRTIIYCGKTPPTNWVATSQTYVPKTTAYYGPMHSMNSAQIYPMINWSGTEFEYTGKAPSVEWTNNVEGYTATFTQTEMEKNAGTWNTVLPVTFTNGEETFTAECVYNYTINKAPLIVKAENASRTYGDVNPSFTCTYSGFVNGEDASVLNSQPSTKTSATSTSNVGTYAITVSGGKAQNYTLSYEAGKLTVLPANLVVTVNDASRTYGDENPSFALTYSGLKNGETVPAWTTAPTFTTDATKTSDAGTYEVDVIAEPKNYTITTKQKGTLTVTQAPLTLKVDDATRPYYADDPEFTFTCAGFKNDDNVSVLTAQPIITPDAIKRSYVGTYDLNASDAEAKNYAITYEPGTLTITARPLTVTPNSVSRPYGEINPAFTCSYEGFVNNETEKVLSELPTVTTSATIGSNAGSYDLRVSGGKATNYTLSYQKGTLTIEPRELTVSVGDYERDYGEENPTFDIVYDNFGAGDNENSLTYKPTVRTTATKTSDVGTYPITVSGAYSPNYNINYVPGLLTINRAEQIFTWEQDLSDLRVGDQVELNAIASSGLPVTFTMADNDIVDVYQAGRKTYMECLKPGTVVIKAQQEGNKNYYPTQRITKTIIVNVATSVNATEESAIRIRLTAFGIRILNAEGETARIYTPDGVLVKAVKVAGAQMDVDLPEGGIYLVKVADKTVKVSR